VANIFKAKTLVGRTGIFSHEVIAPNLVYNTGNQTISGNKTFINNVEVQGTGIFNAVDLSNISEFQFSGTDINLINSNIYISGGGSIYISGNPVLTGVDLSSYATITNLASTGSTLDSKINALSGVSVLTFGNQTIYGDKTFDDYRVLGVRIISGLQGSQPHSLNLIAANDNIIGAPSAVAPGGNIILTAGTGTVLGNSDYGGITLYAGGPQFDGDINLYGNIRINKYTHPGFPTVSQHNLLIYKTGSAAGWGGQVGTMPGLVIDNDNISLNEILPGFPPFGLIIGGVPVTPALYVNTTTNQTIGGLKTFTSSIDIYSGTNPQSLRIFNATGTNSGEFGLFGWQNNNLIIGSQATNFGILRDLTLTGANININASGVLNIFDPTNIVGNLNVTGNILLSGNSVLTGVNLSSYATITNLASTGSTLDNKINALSGVSVLTFGNQIISGNKTFVNNIGVSGTGVFNAIDLNNVDTLSISGADVSIVNGTISLTNRPNVNGTGVVLSGELNSTGIFLNNKINSLSGYVDYSLYDIVYITGIQTIVGRKGISSISGNGALLNPRVGLELVTRDNIFTPTFGVGYGGNINIVGGSGLSDGGSVNLYGGTQANEIYGGNVNIFGNLNFNPFTNISRTINIYKSGLVFGTATSFPSITIDQDKVSINSPMVGALGNGIGLYISGVGVTPALYVNTTTNQTINGAKTFTSGIDIYSGTSPQSLRIFNATGTNSGEFGLFGWQNNNLIIGSQATNFGILRDLTLTGANININASGLLNIYDNTNLVGSLTVSFLTSGGSGIFGKDQSFNASLYPSMPGGETNSISGNHSAIGGGVCNLITGVRSTIGGGCSNIIQGNLNTIGGGRDNIIGSVGSSFPNIFNASNLNNVIAGGICNFIGPGCTVFNNFIGGGLRNCITHSLPGFTCANNNSILGGSNNSICFQAHNSIIGGFCNNLSSYCSTVILGGICNSGASSVGVLFASIIGGNRNRLDNGDSSVALGGCDNKINGNCSSIIGGHSNLVGIKTRGANAGFIAGGGFNIITGNFLNCTTATEYSSIFGGYSNKITSCFASVLGGRQNFVSHIGATVIGDGGSRGKASRGACSLSLDFNGGIFLTGSNITLSPSPLPGRVDFCDSNLINATSNILNANTNFSIGTGYNSRIVLANSGSMLTGTISFGNPTGFNTSIIQIGAGQVQITGSAGVTLNSYNNQFRTAGQYATISLLHSGDNGYIIYGNTAI